MDRVKIGDDVFYEKELRTVIELGRNNRNEMIVLWSSPRSEGACIPSVWWEWCCNEEDEPKKTPKKAPKK